MSCVRNGTVLPLLRVVFGHDSFVFGPPLSTPAVSPGDRKKRRCGRRSTRSVKNYTSIDPNQFQNNPRGPMLVKTICWYVLPSPPRANCFINDVCRHRSPLVRPHSSPAVDHIHEKLTMYASHGHNTGPHASPLLSRASDWTSFSIVNTRPLGSGARPVSVARAGQHGQRTTTG